MEEKELKPDKLLIQLPPGSVVQPSENEEGGLDLEAFLLWLMELVKSPEFSEHIIPFWTEHLKRKHAESMEQAAINKKQLELKEKFSINFLWARVGVGILLIAAFIILAITGKIATETTIVALMATLGIIIWGKSE